jgi:AAA+ superfamily predicted ATPase
MMRVLGFVVALVLAYELMAIGLTMRALSCAQGEVMERIAAIEDGIRGLASAAAGEVQVATGPATLEDAVRDGFEAALEVVRCALGEGVIR